MLITVSVTESGFWHMKPGNDNVFRLQFQLDAYYQHMVGDVPGSNILLATIQERVFRPCGGVFPPCDYLAIGPVLSASGPIERAKHQAYQHLLVDVGLPLGLDRRIGSFGGRAWDMPTVEEGEWVAAIGRVSEWGTGEPGPDEPAVVCRAIEGHGVDLNPASPTFGQVVSWPLGTCPPHDPDVIGFPICFVSFEVIDVS